MLGEPKPSSGALPQGNGLRLKIEHDNLRAALSWCLETDPTLGLELAASLGGYWVWRGLSSEGRHWYRELLALAVERTADRAMTLLFSGVLALDQGDLAEGASLLAEGLAVAREVGDAQITAWLLIDVATAAMLRSDCGRA